MSDFKRLSQQDKITFAQAHQNIDHDKLADKFIEGVDRFENLPGSREFILISKPEVTDQVWDALVKSRIGKVIDFDNGDSDDYYKKGMVVEKNLFEAFIQFITILLQKFFEGLTGSKVRGSGHDDDRAQGRPRRPRTEESGYDR